MSRRVVQVGLGPIGRAIAANLTARARCELVGAIDPALAGQRLDELVPGARGGLVVARSIEELDPATYDAAVVATGSRLDEEASIFRTLLERGKAVVGTCEELIWPWLHHRELAEELAGVAREHGGRLLGTGVNPGFLMDTLPIVLSGVCQRVERVRVWRIQDARARRAGFQAKICAGLDRHEASERVSKGQAKHVGLGESMCLLAEGVGLELTSWNESVEFLWAEQDTDCALGPIKAGHVRGITQQAVGLSGDEPVIELFFTAAIDQADPYDRVEIVGSPSLDMRLAGGVHGDDATAAIAVNAIASLMVVGPGLHTPLTVPIFRPGW